MDLYETLAIALGVSLDAFAVTLALGLTLPSVTTSIACRAVAALMIPSLAMLLVGEQLAEHCLQGSVLAECYFAPLALGWIGSVMIAGQSRQSGQSETPASWLSLIVLGCAASVDVGAAGMAMGIEGGVGWLAMCLIPALTGSLSLCGLLLGSRIGHNTGRYAEIAGGSLLVAFAQYRCLF